jgi:predicted nucleic acid-binding protein
MSDRIFVDTNVLVYADDAADPVKRDRAQELIRQLIHVEAMERSSTVV